MRILKVLLIVINFILTILTSTGLLIAVISSITPPSTVWWLTYFSMVAPFLVILTLVMFLINLIRVNILSIFPLVAILSSLGLVWSQFSLPINKEYDQERPFLKIMTHNICLFSISPNNSSIDSTYQFILNEKPDIIALQEFKVDKNSNKKFITPMEQLYKYDNIALNNSKKYGSGLATFSKYPIIDKGELLTSEKITYAQWSDIVVKSDTIRFFNLHLYSNHITSEDKSFLSTNTVANGKIDTLEKRKAKDILKKLRDNTITRSLQADTVAMLIEQSPYEVIVAGDFNDVPFSYCFNTIKSDLNDSFTKKGDGYAFSYNQLGGFLKIDYILSSKKYKVDYYESKNIDYSDHNPVVIKLKR